MHEDQYTYTDLGILLGIILGAGLGVTLMAVTGQSAYVALTGVGVSLGLCLGAGADRARELKEVPVKVRKTQ